MRWRTMLTISVLLCAVLPAPAKAAESWVAEPERALAVEWRIPEFAGRDFWTLLDPKWLELPGLKDEAFVRDSGLMNVRLPLIKESFITQRVLVLREIAVFQGGSQENTAPQAALVFRPDEKATVVLYPQNATDNRPETSAFISADPRPVKTRYAPVRAELEIRLAHDAPLDRIVIDHGAESQADLATVTFAAVVNGVPVSLVPAKIEHTPARLTAWFANAPSCPVIRLECVSARPLIKLGSLPEAIAARCLKAPFYPQHPFRLNQGSVLGLGPENIDRASWQEFSARYQTTFMGFYLGEWDSNLFQLYKQKGTRLYNELLEYVDEYETRQEAEKQVRTIWEYEKQLYQGNVWGLSGQLNFPQYGLEWGGRIAGMELAGNSPNFPHRNNLLFTRGAARQYERPWLLYLAYYAGSATTNSKANPHAKGSSQWIEGEDLGIAPSLGRRLFYLSYYLGVNFLTFESQPWGQVKETEDGTCALTQHGQAIKDIYTWVHSAKGERGSCYTPILLLLDYHHGHAEWRRGQDWKIWYHLPFEDGDYMTEHVLRCIDPYTNAKVGDFPPYSPNLHNSALGDIFDAAFANAPSGLVAEALLDKYPVVMLLDDMNISFALSARLKRYVRDGGTLVINSAQCQAGLSDERFLGLRLLSAWTEAEDMRIRQVTIIDAKPLVVSEGGLPLVTRNVYGNGNVILTTPHYMLLNEKKTPSPLIAEILAKLQAEVLPIKVQGDVQFLFNRLGNGTWKVILINNKGVLKLPESPVETRDHSYDADVRITAPAGTHASEIMAGAEIAESVEDDRKVFSLQVPAGEVRVVDVQNLTFQQRRQDRSLVGNWAFDEGEGTAARDSSGNGHDGVINGAAYEKSGAGHCLKLNGKDNYVWFDFPLKYPLEEGTFEAWACPNLDGYWLCEELAGTKRGDVVNTGNILMIVYDGHWLAMLYDNINVVKLAGPEVVNHKWTHLVFTWAGFTSHFYVDGVEVVGAFGPMKYAGPIGNARHSRGKVKFYVGSQNPRHKNLHPFNGKIDDVRLYNRQLTKTEIEQHCTSGRPDRPAK